MESGLLDSVKRYVRHVSEDSHAGVPGRAQERVLKALRSAMADGTYPPGAHLPPQRELASRFGVARDTVQRALKVLSDEGLIESRQGSASTVLGRVEQATADTRGRTHTLASFIGRAFERPEVVLDVYTLTSETLDAHIRLQAERIRAGDLSPERITLRMMVPDEELELPYPRSKANPADGRAQSRLHRITREYVGSLKRTLHDLREGDCVPFVEVRVRRVPLTPTFKLYLARGEEALFGPYTLIERSILLDDTDEEIEALDVLGIDATLTYHVKDRDEASPGSSFVRSQQEWFDSLWTQLARDDEVRQPSRLPH
ncbi:GntR family transcriptional regulator [Streptomyces levis]|uniref:GntR family transcriptional regulator n=1 Tax=Streptomyces levis TaxID=285566 RepID=UPI003CD06FFF